MASALSKTVTSSSFENQRSLTGVPRYPTLSMSMCPAKLLSKCVITMSLLRHESEPCYGRKDRCSHTVKSNACCLRASQTLMQQVGQCGDMLDVAEVVNNLQALFDIPVAQLC